MCLQTKQKNLIDIFNEIDITLGHVSGDLNKQLCTALRVAVRATDKRDFGQALAKLREARQHIERNPAALYDYRAEVHATWAYFFVCGGIEVDTTLQDEVTAALAIDPEDARLQIVLKLMRDRGRLS